MLNAIFSLTAMGLTLGFLLGLAAKYLRVEGNPLGEDIEKMMPGSQCGQCGFPGCTPAAQALAEGKAKVTLCPPGGRTLAAQLAEKLGVVLDLSTVEDQIPQVAFVNEELCIGCTKCFKKCPTDALMGASRQIHVVIQEACTGCGKCVEICPTECLRLRPVPQTMQTWYWPKPLERAA